jgi:hypothetical protein
VGGVGVIALVDEVREAAERRGLTVAQAAEVGA